MKPFEQEIKDRIDAKTGRGGSVGCTGLWIRGHLNSVGSDFLSSMHKNYKQFCREIGHQPSRYPSFVRYIKELKEKGLVEEIGTEPASKSFLADRKYYQIKNASSRLWSSPF